MLLQRRPRDDDAETGLIDWPFVSVQERISFIFTDFPPEFSNDNNNEIRAKYWGERPRGKWRLVVALKGVNRELAKMTKFKLGACLIYFISKFYTISSIDSETGGRVQSSQDTRRLKIPRFRRKFQNIKIE